MSNKEILNSMLLDIINDRHEQASVSMHDYIVAKTREISGLVPAEKTEEEDLSDFSDDQE